MPPEGESAEPHQPDATHALQGLPATPVWRRPFERTNVAPNSFALKVRLDSPHSSLQPRPGGAVSSWRVKGFPTPPRPYNNISPTRTGVGRVPKNYRLEHDRVRSSSAVHCEAAERSHSISKENCASRKCALSSTLLRECVAISGTASARQPSLELSGRFTSSAC